MEDCIFCKIVRGEIPSHKIIEDDQTYSFLDISPLNPGHALVVPKEHQATFFDMPAESLNACFLMAQRVGAAVMKTVEAAGMNLLINNYRAAGQLIHHVHIHLIPRYKRDGVLTEWPSKSYGEGEAQKLLGKIQNIL